MQEAIKALVAAQAEMTAAYKGKVNPAFRTKYATLSDVMDACLPALRSNGFAMVQRIGRDEAGPYVETCLMHESGGTFASTVHLILGKNDMQGFGSAVTYARRYGLAALAGITDTDDDGNAATKSVRSAPQRPVETPHDPETGEVREPLNPAQAASQGLHDAFMDGIRDSMPFDCSTPEKFVALHPAQKLQFWGEVATVLITALRAKKTPKAVQAQWDRRDDTIMEMQADAPVHYHRVLDAFNDKMAELRDPITFGDVRVPG